MKNNTMKTIGMTLAALVALSFASCVDDKSKDEPLSISAEGTVIGNNVAQTSFMVISKVDWTLEEDIEWIAADIHGGSPSTSPVKVTLTVDPNEGETPRTGNLYLHTADDTYTYTVTQNGTNTLVGINRWIYETLSEWYYWNDAVKAAAPPDNALAYSAFLERLLANLDGAEDTTENPPTMDGGYDVDANGVGSRYIYSYIVQTSGTRVRAASMTTTFGFGFEPFILGSYGDNRIGFLVTWVQPDGPAYNAGLRRGMWIDRYDGNAIYAADYEDFWYRLYEFRGGTSMNITNADGTEYSLTATSMKTTPIIHDEVITSDGGKKVAYLAYNAFEMGDTDSRGNGEFDNDLREVFGGFRSEGATELVLDLRYNRGGDVTSCRILTSLAGNVRTSETFAKLLYNDEIALSERFDNPELLSFLDEENGLGLEKIYVLCGADTASASEMVVSALRGVDIGVTLIGEKTEGKNVGMNLFQVNMGGASYELWPITFKILNAKDFCDYAGGFEPDVAKDEFRDITDQNGSGVIHQLGDPYERLLGTALTMIDGGNVTPDAATRTVDVANRHLSALRETARGGARMYELPKAR